MKWNPQWLCFKRYPAKLRLREAPIYAKMTWDGSRILHHDIYALGGATLAVEQAFMADEAISVAPGLSIGFGARVFLPNGAIIRVQFRDDILFQGRPKTAAVQGFYVKQNATLSVGYTLLRK